MSARDFFRPGHNCWRVERAGRVAFLVDAAEYFAVLHEALQRAQHSIRIIGWDIDSRTRLVRDTPANGAPDSLYELLKSVVSRRPKLHAYVLDWDFAMLYALDREWLPIFKLDWRAPRRLHFHLDNCHPVGGSQHQKIVVIDDRLAFVGGLDLTKCRWDTPEHRPNDPRRVTPDGTPYPPFHDIQMMIDGPAAAAVAELSRARWQRATDNAPVTAAGEDTDDPWPESVQPVLTDVDVAIARTDAGEEEKKPIQEIRQLYLDAIAAAKRFIYLENQYLTSGAIADALAARLAEERGPEVVFVGALRTDGWLAQHTMDTLRARTLQRLRKDDPRRRFRAYYPDVEGLGDDSINVHSKLATIDDELLLIGSANLNNRSLAFDSECNLALAARGDERIAAAIAGLRNRLLGEHLGRPADSVGETVEREGSLIAATEQPGRGGRSLRKLDPSVPPEVDALVPASEILDPEHPVTLDQMAEHLVPEEEHPPVRRRTFVIVGVLVLLLGLAAAWRWSPLGEWLDVDTITAYVSDFRGYAWAPWALLAGYLVGGLLVVPITLLVTVTIAAFGAGWGFVYSLIGSILSAALVFGIGHALGRGTVRRLAGSHISRLSRRLARQGILTIVIVRLVPIAPFSVVNLVMGASHIRLRDFLVGTAIGLTPGIAAVAFFIDRIFAALTEPKPMSFVFLAAAIAVIVLGAWGVRRWIAKRNGGSEHAAAYGHQT